MESLQRLRAQLRSGAITSRALVERALASVERDGDEGKRSFLRLYRESAMAEAELCDRYREHGVQRSAVDGLPISVKDVFDVVGDVTRAGSRAHRAEPLAPADAHAVARLRSAGAIIIGRTNMVEFAFGGTGVNPHFGSPRNPSIAGPARTAGGSSSGAAVAVAKGQGVMGLATDTRGSARVPAALCGVVGYKATASRISRSGVFPLSPSLDSVGVIAPTVACCAEYAAVLSDRPSQPVALPARALRFLLPRCELLQDLAPEVGRAFERTLQRLSAAGVSIREQTVPALDCSDVYFARGGLAGVEAAWLHRRRETLLELVDPRIARRLAMGGEITGVDYYELQQLRAAAIAEVRRAFAGFHGAVLPTVPCTAPTFVELEESESSYLRWNTRLLRNTGVVNFFDGCAVSVPCHEPGSAPVGFMVVGAPRRDSVVLGAAAVVEECVQLACDA